MKIKQVLNSIKFAGKKNAPELLLGTGIIGVCASTILACRATLQVDSILADYEEGKERIDHGIDQHELEEINYPPEVAKKDQRVLKMQTATKFVEAYAPSATLMGVSIACILGSYRIMSKRQVALMAAYKVMEEAFVSYRGRVVDEFGEEKDAHFMYGTNTITEEETIVDENGKKKKVKKDKEVISDVKTSGFGRVFEEENPDQYGGWTGSTQWSPIHDYNLSFLESKEKYFNDKLVAKGHVTMNEVYEELGFAPTEAGMIVGWKYKSENGDSYISFRPRGIDGNWAFGKDGDGIIMDFNFDGVIFNQNIAQKELR